MANFEKELPLWEAEGVRPPDNVLKGGWKASQKPPADYFNWFFSRTHFALKELQEKAATADLLNQHQNRKDNPHTVTAAQVGLGNLINQKQATKTEFDSHNSDADRHITKDERAKWNTKAEGVHTHSWGDVLNVPISSVTQQGLVKLTDSVASTDKTTAATPNSVKTAYDRGTQGISDAANVQKNLDTHTTNKGNPHGVTASQLGLGTIKNYDIATADEAKTGTVNNKYMTPLLTFEAIKVLQAVRTVNGRVGDVVVTKMDVGLPNLDNVQQASKTEFNTHNNDATRHITTAERADWNAIKPTIDNLANGYRFYSASSGVISQNLFSKDLLDSTAGSHDWAYINATTGFVNGWGSSAGFVKRVKVTSNIQEVYYRPFDQDCTYRNVKLNKDEWIGWKPVMGYGYSPSNPATLTELPTAPQDWEYVGLPAAISPTWVFMAGYLRIVASNASRIYLEFISLVDGRTYTNVKFDATWKGWNKPLISDDFQTAVTKPVEARPDTYPFGFSIMSSTTGYPAQYATIITFVSKIDPNNRSTQTVVDKGGQMWVRAADVNAVNGWSEFTKIAKITDNVASATKLLTPRQIAGVSFDGTANIAIPAGNVGAYTKAEIDTLNAATKVELNTKTNLRGHENGAATLLAANVDLNTLMESGTFRGNALINTPSTAIPWWYIVSIVHSADYKKQIAFPLSTGANSAYIRHQAGGVWYGWKRLADIDEVVTVTGNQTVLGVKNYQDGLQINGINVYNSKIYSQSCAMGFSLTGMLTRVGNTVNLSVHSTQASGRGDGQTNLTESIPIGYRPTQIQAIPAMVSIGTGIATDRYLTQIIRNDGSMLTYNKNINATLSISFAASWITNDTMPV